MSEALLEVTVLHARDVPGCVEGGADRLVLLVPDAEEGPVVGTSPDVAAASAVIRASDLPVRVVLRLGDGFTTTGGEFVRLVGLAQEYVALGAEGVVFGFLDADLARPRHLRGARGRTARGAVDLPPGRRRLARPGPLVAPAHLAAGAPTCPG